MGTKYTTQAISGYNGTPPADDGTEVSANAVSWQTHLDKIGSPLKTAIEAIDSALVTALDFAPVVSTTGLTITAAHYGKVIECTGTNTISLLALATAGAGFYLTIKNTSTGVVTVDGSGSETIDGSTTVALTNKESITIMVDEAIGDWMIVARNSGVARAVNVYSSASQVINSSEKLNFNVATYNPNTDFDITTNNRYDPPYDGIYRITVAVQWINVVAADQLNLHLRYGATPTYLSQQTVYAGGITESQLITWVGSLTIGDYVEVYAENVARDTSSAEGGLSYKTKFMAEFIGS